ncbi:hypothetical protein [Ktedonobacter racemifer]|uniref:Uncharacterized protein n=1 Tax=Ktedonobacter racemifer DSM 44963 TaxID=485913 RepID=D6TLG6_KTERA|nr:hypothetical protein [Ktedonobacter racemifer]EFH86616.1 hypothetical protein Krac_7921 [Ktedonobacter racemifer DSM 44963]
MTQSAVTIQITPVSVPSTPSWLGEAAAFAQVLIHLGLLKTIQEQVRFTRARFGTYDTIDFVVVLIGYALSGEPTLKAFYERLSSGSLFTTSGDHTKAWDIRSPNQFAQENGLSLVSFSPLR